jgi:hypothetical protein
VKINTEHSNVDTNNSDMQSMDFGIGDVSTIIDILRNRLYSNPIRTLTQEYLCNGRDSHREAGRENTPLCVTLPTKLESTLKIRDYGVGLSPDRVKDVFVNYGSSTKRKDNIQTGGFGIGAKSAWAYTDSFVVVSYHDGVARTYAAHTGKNSNGTLELINEENTSEKNGVEIQIPVKESDIEFFVNAVYRCTFFWDVKPDLKGITEIEIPKDYTNLETNIIAKEKNWLLLNKTDLVKRLFDAHNAEIFVLIDKIPYSINKFLRECPEVEKLRNSTSAPNSINFIEVDNGVLEVSATRESISDKDSSKAKVNQLCKDVNSLLADHVNNFFKAEPTSITEYVEKINKCKQIFHLNQVPGFKDENFARNNEECTFTKDGIKYSVKNGQLTSPSINEVSQFFLDKQKSRHVLKRTDNAIINISNRDINDIFFVINDLPANFISELAFKEKIRSILLARQPDSVNGSYPGTVYYINRIANPVPFVNFVKARYISEVEVAKTPAKPKKEAGSVTLRKLIPNGQRYSNKVEVDSKVDISLEELVESEKTYVIVPFSSDPMYELDNSDFYQNLKFIYSQGKNMEVVKCSKKEYEVLCLLDNTIEYCTLIENFPQHIQISDDVIRNHFNNTEDGSLEVLRKYVGEIVCENIKKYFSAIPQKQNNANNHVDIPERILDLYEAFSKAKLQKDKIEQLKQSILEKYPLIKHLSQFHSYSYSFNYGNRRDDTMIKEIIFYINSKSRSNR